MSPLVALTHSLMMLVATCMLQGVKAFYLEGQKSMADACEFGRTGALSCRQGGWKIHRFSWYFAESRVFLHLPWLLEGSRYHFIADGAPRHIVGASGFKLYLSLNRF